MRRFLSLITLIAFSLVTLFGLLSSITLAQDNCGSGVVQRLVVGDQGHLIPGQSSNRVRDLPNGTKIGSIEPIDVFTVIDGPSCLNNISWWKITTANGLTGWTAEGVAGEAYLEPISDSARGGGAVNSNSLVNTNSDCSSVTSQLKLGMYVKLNVPYEDIDEFYGSPYLQNTLYRFPDKPFDVVDYSLFETGFDPNTTLLLQEGPVCFNGNFLWKLSIAYPDSSFVGNYDTPLVWIYENKQDTKQIAPVSIQPKIQSAFEPTKIDLRKNESAPLIDANSQLQFSYGGGCEGKGGCFGLGGWSPRLENSIPCFIGWFDTGVDYYNPDCIDIYPFDVGESVQVTIRRPDGSIYFQGIQEAQKSIYYLETDPIDYEANDHPQVVSFGVIRVSISPKTGDPSGVWTVEAEGKNQFITQTYILRQKSFMDFECDGPMPIIVFNDFPPKSKQTLVYAMQTSFTYGAQYFDFKEVNRWQIGIDQNGALIAVPNFDFLRGIIAIDNGQGWQKNVNLRLGTNYDASTPKRCHSYFSFEDAIGHPISYNSVVTGGFGTYHYDELQEVMPNTYYAFQGHQNDLVSLSLMGFQPYGSSDSREELSPTISLIAPDGTTLEKGNSDLNSITLPMDGLYEIELGYTNDGQVTNGIASFIPDYTLILNADPHNGVNQNVVLDIQIGTPVTENLTEKSSWTFAGTKDEEVIIDLSSSEFDPLLTLKDSTGKVLAEDDDSGDGMSSQIKIALPQTGIYTAEVNPWNKKTGQYLLEIHR